MSTLTSFAKDELTRAGMSSQDSDYGGMLGDAVMELVERFSEQGHSGFSASIAISLFQKVARFEPLTPLTGEDSEWILITDGLKFLDEPLYQNRRCSRVFKDKGGAYDAEGKVFREPSGASYTSRDSRVSVAFPYTPKTTIVEVSG